MNGDLACTVDAGAILDSREQIAHFYFHLSCDRGRVEELNSVVAAVVGSAVAVAINAHRASLAAQQNLENAVKMQ